MQINTFILHTFFMQTITAFGILFVCAALSFAAKRNGTIQNLAMSCYLRDAEQIEIQVLILRTKFLIFQHDV